VGYNYGVRDLEGYQNEIYQYSPSVIHPPLERYRRDQRAARETAELKWWFHWHLDMVLNSMIHSSHHMCNVMFGV
jgi:hypothetical protein